MDIFRKHGASSTADNVYVDENGDADDDGDFSDVDDCGDGDDDYDDGGDYGGDGDKSDSMPMELMEMIATVMIMIRMNSYGPEIMK